MEKVSALAARTDGGHWCGWRRLRDYGVVQRVLLLKVGDNKYVRRRHGSVFIPRRRGWILLSRTEPIGINGSF